MTTIVACADRKHWVLRVFGKSQERLARFLHDEGLEEPGQLWKLVRAVLWIQNKNNNEIMMLIIIIFISIMVV